MPARQKSIPVHKLKEVTDQGFQIDKVHPENRVARKALLLEAHRDDHYIFLFQQAGKSKCMVDFSYFHLHSNQLLFILPGQVHQYLESDPATEGWFLAVDAGLVPGMFRGELEDPLLSQKPLALGPPDTYALCQCLELIFAIYQQQPAPLYFKQSIYGLLTSFVAMVSALYSGRPNAFAGAEKLSRPVLITRKFRKILSHEYKTRKSPAEYADALNISLTYLNEAVKKTTGFAVSYWIQQEIVLEAKRLLYHSESSVKEIAYALGYEDPAYFARLFKRMVSVTPGDFRKSYRE